MNVSDTHPMRSYHIHLIIFTVLLLSLSAVMPANAYNLYNLKWPQPTTSFYVDIPGANGLWNSSFEGAMFSWGNATAFNYTIHRGSYEDPCDAQEGRNGVAFSASNCGDAWGDETLAFCQFWYVGETLIQADIVFNSNLSWNVYSTPWQSDLYDFQRVAVHELGHALGLNHEDSGVPSIMRTFAGDITLPQQDDIDGVAAIYGAAVAISPPAALTVPASDADGRYTVSWGSSTTSGVSYVLEEATNSGFTAGLRQAFSGSATSTVITGRSSGVTYFYRVKAIKSGSPDSPWVTAGNGCAVLSSSTFTAADADKAFRAINNAGILTPAERIRYDVAPLSSDGTPGGNGVIDIADVVLILRSSFGVGSR